MKILLSLLFNGLTFLAYSQNQTWTTYFPVRDNIIGKTFIGKTPLDSKVVDDIDNVSVTTSNSATSFTLEQQRTAELIWNKLFEKNKLRVSHVEAYKVKIDQISNETKNEMPPGIPFVYAGLKADSTIITFKKSKRVKIDSSPIIDSLKKIYPNVSETEIGKLTEFLKFTRTTKDSVDFKMTITNTNVYFLIQVAEFVQLDRADGINWNKYCASFLNSDGVFADSIILVDSADAYKSGEANTHYARIKNIFKNLPKASVWFEIDENQNLAVHSKASNRETEKIKILKERNKTWRSDNIVIRSYPYKSDNNSERYKDIILVINAKRVGNRIIIYSGATEKDCGETYIYYPETELRWKYFNIR